jgi:hypothetical protein
MILKVIKILLITLRRMMRNTLRRSTMRKTRRKRRKSWMEFTSSKKKMQ